MMNKKKLTLLDWDENETIKCNYSLMQALIISNLFANT